MHIELFIKIKLFIKISTELLNDGINFKQSYR